MSEQLAAGQAPWDDWPREKLLREVQRMYAALVASRTALALAENADTLQRGGWQSPFWQRAGGEGGTGGTARATVEAAIAPYLERDEEIYRAYFRMRTRLLFPEADIGMRWYCCPEGHCFGGLSGGVVAGPCQLCGGDLHELTWGDFEIDQAEGDT